MSFEFFIGGRYLRAKQKQAFISLITYLSIAGVAVGVMALIVVIAVMAGFEADLKTRILGGQANVILLRYQGPFDAYREVMQRVDGVPGVTASTPFIYSQVMLRTAANTTGAVLRGIDPATIGGVLKTLENVKLPESASTGDAEPSGSFPGIVLGRELAKNLGVVPGDTVHLISPRGMLAPTGHVPAMKPFRVSSYFESGMYEFDQTFAYIHLHDAQRLLRMGDAVTGVEVRVEDIYQARAVADAIVAQLGSEYYARDWMQMNRNLFKALKLERRVMFIILTLIVLVAAFNIASSLIMMVMGKTKDIAILKAMGATNGSIRKIFVFNGMVIGTIGTGLGLVLGVVLCNLLRRYNIHELTGDIYYFTTQLPVKMEAIDVACIVAAALVICFLATIYPARQAAKLNPVEAIRYG
ncbi:MAG TPA: lipoprotein-releasing ABC transporter permease subunit [Desulfobacterales bacterium]|jgi:lipoprotein-releasing system permease protein|nr:lipoprotein-releasing ABC transporter permease subunit [Desulfobacterales bacterium]